jgi:hypothetical protein
LLLLLLLLLLFRCGGVRTKPAGRWAQAAVLLLLLGDVRFEAASREERA